MVISNKRQPQVGHGSWTRNMEDHIGHTAEIESFIDRGETENINIVCYGNASRKVIQRECCGRLKIAL